MGELCGAYAKSEGRGCRRRVKPENAPCWQHSRVLWTAQDRSSVEPITGGSGRSGRTDDRTAVESATVAGTPLCQYTSDAWIGTAYHRIARLAGKDLADRLVRERRGGGCKPIAEIARKLLDAEGTIRETGLDLVGIGLPAVRQHRPARKIAEKLVEQVPLNLPGSPAQLGRAMQAVGIWVCIVGKRPLSRCHCWNDLQRTQIQHLVDTVLHEALTTVLDRANEAGSAA